MKINTKKINIIVIIIAVLLFVFPKITFASLTTFTISNPAVYSSGTSTVSVTLSGKANKNSDSNPSSFGGTFNYSTTNLDTCNKDDGSWTSPDWGSEVNIPNKNTDVSFSKVVTLDKNKLYYYCAKTRYGIANAAHSYGEVKTFSTDESNITPTNTVPDIQTGGVSSEIDAGNGNVKATLNAMISQYASHDWYVYFVYKDGDVTFCNNAYSSSSSTCKYTIPQKVDSLDSSFDASTPFSDEIIIASGKNISYRAVLSSVNFMGNYSVKEKGEIKSFTATVGGTTANNYIVNTPGVGENDEYDYTNFTTQAGLHNVHTSSEATSVEDTSATLSGSATLTMTPVYGYFRYSSVDPGSIAPIFCNEVFGDDMKSTPEKLLGNDPYSDIPGESSRKTFSMDISKLEPNTKYYYCAVASDKKVIEYGKIESFVTGISVNPNSSLEDSLTSIKTKPATNVTANSAYLNGSFNTAVPSKTYFQYRKKANYAAEVAQIIENIANPNKLSGGTNNSTNVQDPYDWSAKINTESHLAGTNGSMSFFLKNLTKNTNYEFRAVSQTNVTGKSPYTSYGSILSFRTSSSSLTSGDVPHTNNINTTNTNNGSSNNTENLTLGQIATPPVDALVRYHEGIETVFARQLIANSELANIYGYTQGMDLNTFAWDTADFLARTFGYVSPSGKEIRVSNPDIAAYQLSYKNGKLTVYEYYNSKIVAIQNITSSLRSKYYYEYYFLKK